MSNRSSKATGSLRPGPSTDGRRALVLYVEDDDLNWEVAQYRLGKTYELLRACTAEQACAIVRAQCGELDAILMDIELRGSDLNGVELTELMRGNTKLSQGDLPGYARNLPYFSKPVVYVTAHGASYTRVHLMLTGAERVIEKPINFTELRATLAQIMPGRSHD